MNENEWAMIGAASMIEDKFQQTPTTNKTAERYLKCAGFDIKRQVYLQLLPISKRAGHDECLEAIVGHKVNWKKYGYRKDDELPVVKDLLKEIAKKEGWKYCDYDDLLLDPFYRNIVGAEKPSYDHRPDKILVPEEYYDEFKPRTCTTGEGCLLTLFYVFVFIIAKSILPDTENLSLWESFYVIIIGLLLLATIPLGIWFTFYRDKE